MTNITKRRCRFSILIATLLVAVAMSSMGCDSKSSRTSDPPASEQLESDQSEREHSADNGEWCKGHGLPESHCTKCHPELIDKFKEAGDWCAEHGFPESACPQCNPMDPPGAKSAQKQEHSASNGEWCKGHGLPESHCTKCHPELIDKFKEAGDWCAEHGFPESACPQCNPMDPPAAEGATAGGSGAGEPTSGIAAIPGVEPGTKVVFKQADHEKAVGIETVQAREVPVGLGTRAPARIEFNRNDFADVRAAVPGIVREVLVDLGQEVDKGTALFVLESAHVGEVQGKIQAANEELKTARANLDRQEKLNEKGLTPTRKVEVARQEFEAAESRLRSLKSSLRLAGGAGTSTTGRYTLRAPIAGAVVQRPGVVGAFATEETSLATITDTETMWAMMDVPEKESFALSNGQPVVFTVDGATNGAGKPVEFDGEVTWIAPQVDPRTRTVKVRAEIDNSDGKLRANQFARAEIGIAPDKRGVVVPREAVQRLDEGTVVFVRMKEGTYEPRVVETGRSDGDVVQVRGDLEVGESVVTTGAFVLKTELSKDSIGAGCCEVPE